MTRILLADDHGLVLDGLSSLLATEDEFDVVGRCIDGAEVLEFVARDRPDVLIMDLKMPRMDGLDVLKELGRREILPATVMIAADATAKQVVAARRRGAWGVIMKDRAPAVILESVHAMLAGEEWSSDVAVAQGNGSGPRAALSELTDREVEVTLMAGRGASNKAIARELGIARGTVKVHLHRAYRKLDIRNRVQLALLLRDGGEG